MNPVSPFDTNMQLLSKVMDLRSTKAQIISSNIANAETPGYSPARFEFEKELASAVGSRQQISLAVSNSRHIPFAPLNFASVNGKVTVEEDKSPIGDENGVSVDQEMLALSENELLYETAAQLLKKKLSIYKYVVADGGN